MSTPDSLIKQRDRAEKKAAAANTENAALRAEIRRLRLANFILQQNIDATPAAGYKVRYEKAAEALSMIAELARADINGIPIEPPKTMEPWLGPVWARKKPAAVDGDQP